jgi:urease subunit alpha
VPFEIDRRRYAGLYGPTTGDRVRLGDTNLLAEIEYDHTPYGDEPLAGFGKTVRDSMLATSRAGQDSKLDLIVTSALLLDPVLGIVKGNLGIKDGRIVGVGRSGNPEIVDDPALVIGSNTGLVPAEGLIATPGTVDAHVHLSSTSILPAALAAGTTTLVGMGYGGVWDLGVNPEYNLHRVLESFESWPLNVALLGRGSSSDAGALRRNVEQGSAGLKVHEDVAGYPEVIDAALTVAAEQGVTVALHTDSLNESGDLEDTLTAIDGRTIHCYHVEGAGGGHPNILQVVSEPHVIPSSTTPTLPYSVNTIAEHFDMIMIVHRMSYSQDEDRAAVRARVRPATIAAESLLHDMGAISIIASDSQGMGRIGEVVSRTWQLAHRMKELRGAEGPNDNARIRRYLAKYTLNAARSQGLDHEVGSLEAGKLADVVLWRPEFFGVKPQLVIKGGFVAWGSVGDGNGSTRLAEPQIYRPMFGGLGAAPAPLALTFTSPAGLPRLRRRLATRRRLVAVKPTAGLRKAHLLQNSALPDVLVEPPDGQRVLVDGQPVEVPPAESLPLTRRYFLV